MERFPSFVSPFLFKYNSISVSAIPASFCGHSSSQNATPFMTNKSRIANNSTRSDYYEVLGLKDSCTEKEIRKAYKHLAQMYHPDVNKSPDSAEAFKNIHDAYETLRNSDRRRKYDVERETVKLRSVFSSSSSTVSSPSSSSSASSTAASNLTPTTAAAAAAAAVAINNSNNLFNISNSPSSAGSSASAVADNLASNNNNNNNQNDIFHTVQVSLEDSYTGKRKKFQVSRYVLCKECNSKGLVFNAKSGPCLLCNGKGYQSSASLNSSSLRSGSSLLLKQKHMAQQLPACEECNGTGVESAKKCAACNGTLRVLSKSSVRVNIPAGIASGQQIILKGQGDQATTTTTSAVDGDLVFTIEEKAHDKFTRNGANLFVKHQVTMAELASGVCNLGSFLDGRILSFSTPFTLSELTQLRQQQQQQSAAENNTYINNSNWNDIDVDLPAFTIPSTSSAPSVNASNNMFLFSPQQVLQQPHRLSPTRQSSSSLSSSNNSNGRIRSVKYKCAKSLGMPIAAAYQQQVSTAFGHLYIRFELLNNISQQQQRTADLIPAHFLYNKNAQASTIPLDDVQDLSALPRSFVTE